MEKIIKQKKIWIAAAAGVALLAVLIVVTVLLKGGKEPAYRSIKIVELEGGVSIDRDGVGTLAAAKNMNLVSGDRVTTAENAYVVLCLDTDKYVMLGEAGAMRVVAEGDENRGKTSISLEGGSVLSDIQNPLSEGSSYEIATPNATMSVRGTVFEVKKEDENGGQISVLVYDGCVAVGMGGEEPVLYNAGEYTVFTDSADPEVLVEKGAVSEEVLGEKVRERLQQISTEGRPLNVGSADLSDAAQGNSASTAIPEVTATPAPTATPEVTATPAPTATPEVTATPAPTVTPEVTATPVPTATPEVTATPVPTATPEVTAAPVVTETPEPEEDEEEPEEDEPEPTAVPTPTPTKKPEPTAAPTPAPTKEPEPTQKPTWGPAVPSTPPQEVYFRVSYEIPYVLINGKEPENAGEAESILASHVYASSNVKANELLPWEQGEAEVTSIPNHVELQSLGLEFVGWYKANGYKWNFAADKVMEDTVLYPVWKDKDGNLYKVKVSEELGICYSVKEAASEPGPAPSGEPSPEPSGAPSPAPSGESAGES